MSKPEIDTDRIDEAALALLFLTLGGDGRAWKSIDWEVSDRLHEKGLILDPVNKAKSLVLTEEGQERCKEAYYRLFSKRNAEPPASA